MSTPTQKTVVPIKPSKDEADCLDGFLWIGQSYPEFLCDGEPGCLDRSGHPCFVHEAERRGISRRISHAAPWAIPGRTRVFLAHWDGERGTSRGRIFGYFVLGRTEVLDFADALAPRSDGRAGKHGPEVRTQRCWNGKEIVTHRWNRTRKRWERTRQKCPEFPDLECEDEEFLYAKVEDGGWIATHACIDGDWQPTGAGTSEGIPIEDEVLAEPRGCGVREDPGSVYLVDDLAAAISDAFSARRGPVSGPHDEVKEAFDKVVDEVTSGYSSRARVPGALQGKASVRGGLVLFAQPPLFEKYPQVWFRPLERIDGDDLVEQVVAEEVKVSVHGYHQRRAGAMSQQEVVSVLAERMEANKAFTERLLTELGDLAQEELEAHRKFRVPGVGMLRQENGQVRFEPY